MRYLLVLHDPPYGSERTYNGLRWARQMQITDPAVEVKIFLFGDAVVAAMESQKTPDGFYNTGTMLRALTRKGATVGSCGTCMDTRGIDDASTLASTHRSSMDELAEWTAWADQVINV